MPEINHDELPRLAVPDFSKQEVESISVEAVKKEIAGGNIPVGTKLYKHSIYIEDVNTETDTGYFYVNIISTSNISVNDYNKLSNCLTNATSSSFTIDKAGNGSEPMIGSVISMLGGNTIGIYGYSIADERQHAFEFELSLISDTVTEL